MIHVLPTKQRDTEMESLLSLLHLDLRNQKLSVSESKFFFKRISIVGVMSLQNDLSHHEPQNTASEGFE